MKQLKKKSTVSVALAVNKYVTQEQINLMVERLVQRAMSVSTDSTLAQNTLLNLIISTKTKK